MTIRNDRLARDLILVVPALALLFVPFLHPLLIPLVGAPSHLLWWGHVFPVAVGAYRYGRAGALIVSGASIALLVAGERSLGAGFGAAAAWETVWSLATALSVTHILVAAFALYARGSAARLSAMAYRDSLTGLPNRRYLEECLSDSRRRPAGKLAVFFIDLDDFKTINDSLGHAAGDAVLQAFAARLQSCLREQDVLARWAGDEFVVLMGSKAGSDPARMAERMHRVLDEPVTVQDMEVALSTGIGIAVERDAAAVANLLREADIALSRAKRDGRASHRVYTQDMHAEVARRLFLNNGLRSAIDQREFVNHYQAIHDAAAGTVLGMEALVRWHHAEEGLISPAEFIPFAERSGHIIGIGNIVLVRALEDYARWRRDALCPPSCFVSVNISPVQLYQKNFARQIAEVLIVWDIEPSSLVLEITETAFMQSHAAVTKVLENLREFGVRIAIDDFGSGYSSLGYLSRLPADILKIDRELVRQLEDGKAAIVRPVAEIARALGLRVIAEGVESDIQIERLREMQIDCLQGFRLSRPLDAEAMDGLLRRGQSVSDSMPALER